MKENELTKMNPEIKAHWVAALRSGSYRQTHHKLSDLNGGFCCLGVLSDLYAQEKGVANLYDLEGDQAELPGDLVCGWAGLDFCKVRLVIEGVRCELFQHNDGCGLVPSRTFAEIADAIESQL